MRILDDVAVELPMWVRLVFLVLAAGFGALTFWLAGLGDAGWLAIVGAVLSAALGLLLLVAAIRGRWERWMWLIPLTPGGGGIS